MSKIPNHSLCFINLTSQNRCKVTSIGKSTNTVKIAGPISFSKFRDLIIKEFGESKTIIRKLIKNNSTNDIMIEALLYCVISVMRRIINSLYAPTSKIHDLFGEVKSE